MLSPFDYHYGNRETQNWTYQKIKLVDTSYSQRLESHYQPSLNYILQ